MKLARDFDFRLGIKRYDYSETQQFRCIGVTKRFEYLKKRKLFPPIKYFENLFMIRSIFYMTISVNTCELKV